MKINIKSNKNILSYALILILFGCNIKLVYSQACLEPSPNNPDLCCTGPTRSDDNPPDECLTDITDLVFTNTGICNENFDCCACTSIIVEDARSFICGGDHSCIGVPLTINGNDLGAVLTCNGDLSCYGCKIEADNMIGIRCDGDKACKNTDMYINQNSALMNPQGILFPCNGDGTCENSIINAKNVIGLLCNGDNSCRNSLLTFLCRSNGFDTGCAISGGGDFSLYKSILDIKFATRLQCGGDDSCSESSMQIGGVPGGCIVNCGGDNACAHSEFELMNINLIECVGDYSCAHSMITAECLLPFGCPIRCSAESPCFGVRFRVDNSNGLLCSGLGNACRHAVIELINNVGGMISCLGTRACEKAIIAGGMIADPNNDMGMNVSISTPVERVKDVFCQGFRGCFDADIFVECDETLGCNAMCNGVDSCSHESNDKAIVIYNCKSFMCSGGLPLTPVNPASPACNGNIELIPIDTTFMIQCAGPSACEYGNIMTIIDNELPEISGISCTAGRSCKNTEFKFIYRGFDMFSLKSVMCNGPNSCNTMLLEFTGEAVSLDIPFFACQGLDSCANANITLSATEEIRVSLLCSGPRSCENTTFIYNTNEFMIDPMCKLVNNRNTCFGATAINNITGEIKQLIEYSQ